MLASLESLRLIRNFKVSCVIYNLARESAKLKKGIKNQGLFTQVKALLPSIKVSNVEK